MPHLIITVDFESEKYCKLISYMEEIVCNILYQFTWYIVGDTPPPISCAPAVEVAVLTRCLPVLLIDPGWIFGWGTVTKIQFR